MQNFALKDARRSARNKWFALEWAKRHGTPADIAGAEERYKIATEKLGKIHSILGRRYGWND